MGVARGRGSSSMAFSNDRAVRRTSWDSLQSQTGVASGVRATSGLSVGNITSLRGPSPVGPHLPGVPRTVTPAEPERHAGPRRPEGGGPERHHLTGTGFLSGVMKTSGEGQ